MRTWIKPVLLLTVLVPWIAGACGGVPTQSLLRFAGQQQCDPKAVFAPFKGIPLKDISQVEKSIFVKEERVSCLGIYWEGQTGDPPAFHTLIKSDGSYIVYDPNTKQPAAQDTKIGASIAPGVAEVEVVVCVLNTPTDQILDVDCKSVVRNGASGCMNNPNALFAWRGQKIPMDPNQGNGTCTLCHHERCTGNDNNCDGQVDEDGACGRVLGQSCIFYDKPAPDKDAPACSSKETCRCLRVNTGEYYVCAGKTADAVGWMKVSTAAAVCNQQLGTGPSANNIYYCGNDSLLCDRCEGQNYFWRSRKGKCSDGLLRAP